MLKIILTISKKLTLLLAILSQTITLSHANNSSGELELKNANNEHQQALLIDTSITGNINGMLASISVEQTFQNQSMDWVNGRYVFPLPEGAAVDSLRIKIGERVIDGLVKEKEHAKKLFKQATRAGKKAGLLEQHRPNLFSISVANIGPNEQVIAKITFIDQVKFQNDVFSLTLPTTLTPRYIPDAPVSAHIIQKQVEATLQEQENVDINFHSGWATNTDRVADAESITPPHHFSLSLSLNAGLDLQTVESSSHSISSQFENSQSVTIGLTNNKEKMNSDLRLSWRATVGSVPKAALFQQKFNNAYYSMLMLTPPSIDSALSLPRDITFIIDSSGSMAGVSMKQAKQALTDGLSYLTPNDRFNVIDFDSSFRPLFKQSQPVTLERVESAHKMITQLHAGGGTEMLEALGYAMNSNRDSENYLKQIVFITDGAIGNESELFNLISKNLADTRLFTVGIGNAPNSYFMNKAAKFGRGSYTIISDLSQVNTKIAQLFEKITRPVMRNIETIWPQSIGQTLEQFPARIPDLYAGEPLTLLVKSEHAIGNVTVLGNMLNTPWQQNLSLGGDTATTDNADNLDTVWARQKVESLMDKLITNELTQAQAKSKIIGLGIAHNIATKFTSFIAVENTPSKPLNENAKHKNVANLMPKGNTMPVPQTATPSSLLSLLGLLLLLFGGVLRKLNSASRSDQSLTKISHTHRTVQPWVKV